MPLTYIKNEFKCGPMSQKTYLFKTVESREAAYAKFLSFFRGSSSNWDGEPVTVGNNGSILHPYFLTFYIKLPDAVDAAIQELMGVPLVRLDAMYIVEHTPIQPMPGTETDLTHYQAVPTAEGGKHRDLGMVAKVIGPNHPANRPLCFCDSFMQAESIAMSMNFIRTDGLYHTTSPTPAGVR